MKELLMGRAKLEELDADVQKNLTELHEKMNVVRAAYGKPMKVNDGYRRPADTPKNGSKTSWHLQGCAVDIDDDDAGTFMKWCLEPAQMALFKKLGLYLEDPRWTHGAGSWMHFQSRAPKSGKRIFVPSVLPPSAPKIWDGRYDGIYD